ncbi:MAG: nucleotidyltransferase domain-containing protein, partial [Deltaproteobacteria bacterium]|nr:nucleotidyltransferase domain-containing protein [Deltaproteobacteria bacterium]
QIEDICRRYRVADLYVFGSRAEEVSALVAGKADSLQTSASDVDMGVLPAERDQWGPRGGRRLSMELEDLFQVSRVDLVLLPEADAFLALEIIRGELLYSDDLDRQARYELFVLRRAGDLAPFQKERIRAVLEEGAR